ncbi:MAG: hypothetical protein NC123_20500 [Butyrivibrio sp.]|nr:hypothetical protein [Butyrivibrio sp.]
MQENNNVHPDLAKLSEDSAFYQPENKKTTREKLAEMDARGKIAFIAEYYGLKIILIIAAAAFVFFMFWHFLFSKDIVFNVMAVNSAQEECAADDEGFYSDFLERNGVDLEKGTVSVTAGLGVSDDGTDSESGTNLNTMQTRLIAGSVDVFLANEKVLYSIGEFGYLADLEKALPSEIITEHRDDLVYAKIVETGEHRAVGIRIPADNKWLQSSGWYPEGTVVGIADAAGNTDLALAFILEILGGGQS